METKQAVAALSALAQEHRLAVFRLLVREGESGLPAGEIAERMALPASTLSHHLAQLERAQVLRSWRVQRQIYYAVDLAGTRRLVAFLTEDCCAGRPEICGYGGNSDSPGDEGRPEAASEQRREATKATGRPLHVLFLCTGNSARSIMAECLLNRLGHGRFRAFSAGSHPAGAVNPHALALLTAHRYPTAALRSKAWDEFARAGAPAIDVVITVCDNAAGEVCPVWPGRPLTGHWSIPDPAAATGSDAEIAAAFTDAYRMLERRIDSFIQVASAPLDPERLQQRLAEIGAAGDALAR
jgi:arsenate reductase